MKKEWYAPTARVMPDRMHVAAVAAAPAESMQALGNPSQRVEPSTSRCAASADLVAQGQWCQASDAVGHRPPPVPVVLFVFSVWPEHRASAAGHRDVALVCAM